MSISTIRAIHHQNCLEEDVCLYRPNARWEGEFIELQKIVESRGQKTLKKMVKQHLHDHMLFGRVSSKIILAYPKTNSPKKKKKKEWSLIYDSVLVPPKKKRKI